MDNESLQQESEHADGKSAYEFFLSLKQNASFDCNDTDGRVINVFTKINNQFCLNQQGQTVHISSIMNIGPTLSLVMHDPSDVVQRRSEAERRKIVSSWKVVCSDGRSKPASLKKVS